MSGSFYFLYVYTSYLLASIVYGANNENRNGGQCREYFLFYMCGVEWCLLHL